MSRIALAVALVLAIAASPASAGTLSVQGGVLSYTETDNAVRNTVMVSTSTDGSRITVADSGRTGTGRRLTLKSDGSCTVSGATGSCPAPGVVGINVSTGDQDDAITQNTSIPSRLLGGNGNDRLTGGPGDDILIGEAGSDTLAGGAGRDTADYSARVAPVSVTLNGTADDGEANEKDNVAGDVEVLAGGAADDSLVGNDADNVLLGNAGNDSLSGAGGNDQLDGAAGDDTLNGGTGSDAITGGDGTDTATYADAPAGVRVVLDGKPGDGAPGENDSVDTENVVGSPADDVLIGNAGPNSLSGGAGNDRLLGGKGIDAFDAGPGDDIVQSLDGDKESILCGDGEDGVVSDKRDVRVGCDYIKYRPLAATATALHVSGGTVRAPVRCSPATAEGCSGVISLKAGRTTLGSLAYRLTSGRRWVAKVKLSRKGRAYVAKRAVTKASFVVRTVDATGDGVTTKQTIRIGRG